MNRKKIAILMTDNLPVPDVKGGAIEKLVTNLINLNESEQLFDFTVYTIYDSTAMVKSASYIYTKFVFFKKHEFIDKFLYFAHRVIRKIFNIIIIDSFTRYQLAKKCKYDKYDYVIVEGGNIYGLSRYVKFFNNSPILFHSHAPYDFKPYAKKANLCINYYLPVSEFVGDLRNCKINEFPRRTFVYYNRIALSKFTVPISDREKMQIRKKLGFKETDLIYLFVGRIVREKGVLELVKAFNDSKIDAKLLIIGSANFGNKTKTKYEKIVYKEIAKNKNIVHLDFVENDKISKFYKVSDVSVIPSLFDDPAPLVNLESIASGLPIITTGSGGIKEYSDFTCSLYVSKNNIIDDLKSSMMIMQDANKREQMAICAKEIAKKFDISNYLDELYNIVLTIESERNGS